MLAYSNYKRKLQGLNTGSYLLVIICAKFRALSCKFTLYLSPEPCCAKKKVKQLVEQHVLELLSGVNAEYDIVHM